jgi:Domain of unknown function (DUF4365)
MPRKIRMRPRSHEIGDRAVKVVRYAIPDAWVDRGLGGQDYGIDLLLERFAEGAATGDQLVLQIRGTTRNTEWPPTDAWKVDVEAGLLRYARLFVTPFLLAVVPVEADPPGFCWLWLQEYVDVVVTYDQPDWALQKTVRLSIPQQNCSLEEDFENRLIRIGAHSRVLRSIGRLARAQNEVRFLAAAVHDDCLVGAFDHARENLGRALEELKVSRAADAATVLPQARPIFTEGPVGHAIDAAEAALSSDDPAAFAGAALSLRMAGESLSAFLAVINDPGIRRAVWEVEGGHLF